MLDLGGVWADDVYRPSVYYKLDPRSFTIQAMYPPSEGDIPDYLPEEVERLFKQGANNLPSNPDAAGIMLRKTLEAVLRDKCPDTKGSLFERIDQAAKIGILTADLTSYAHTIRLEGNEAAQGGYDEADAQRLHSLVKLVLHYIYTLPGMQAQVDAEASAAVKNQPAASGKANTRRDL